MEVHRIINAVFTSNTYVLLQRGTNWCWVIDPGDIEPILYIISGDVSLKGIFLTHTHYDHLYGINQIVYLYPDCVVYTSEAGKEGLFSDKLNFSRYHDDPILFSGNNLHILYDDDQIELFPGKFLTVLQTPGHDKSCLTYYTMDEIFTGDSFIPGVKVVTTFPRGDRQEAAQSLQLIMELVEGRDLYPGHGVSFTDFACTDEMKDRAKINM